MPRSFDGPIPERPERNALPDRINDLLDGLAGNDRSGDGEGRGHWFDQLGAFDEHVFGDRGGPDAARAPSDDASRTGPAAPAIAAPAVEAPALEARASADVAARHFEPQGDFGRHLDHYNFQSLSAHSDWFML